MLVALCVLGAAVGILGKLLLESPETFVAVVRIGSFAVPYFLGIGTIIWIGLRGQRRFGLVLWGVVLLLLPVALNLMLALLLPTGDPLRLLTTQRLISNRLPSQIDAPWAWRELERRLATGSLTSDQANSAIQELTAYMKRTSPTGWNRPIPWQRDFLRAAIQKKLVSDDVFFDLCDAFFGPAPRVQPLPSLPADAPGFHLAFEIGNLWSDDSDLGIELVWQVKQVSLDGMPMQLKQVTQVGVHWSAFCEGELPPGEHLLKIEVDCAYVDTPPMVSNPKVRKRWTKVVTVPVTVESAMTKP
jgi:hypothetical protein